MRDIIRRTYKLILNTLPHKLKLLSLFNFLNLLIFVLNYLLLELFKIIKDRPPLQRCKLIDSNPPDVTHVRDILIHDRGSYSYLL